MITNLNEVHKDKFTKNCGYSQKRQTISNIQHLKTNFDFFWKHYLCNIYRILEAKFSCLTLNIYDEL